MKSLKTLVKLSALSAVLASMTTVAHAAIVISEVNPTGSSSAYSADWFELTNNGTSTIDISGWKIDDNSNSASLAVALRGISTIGAGQSVVFLESNASGSNDATIDANFKTAWFGANAPVGFLIGNYGGAGVGFSNSADAVNIFDNTGALVTRVNFGASTAGFTFNNDAGLNNVTISTLSSIGVNGAFLSANGAEVGSPSAVPIPAALPLFMSAFGLMGALAKRRRKTAI